MKAIRKITPAGALERLQILCSAREKCTGDIKEKLRQWNISGAESAVIISNLIRHKFIDDRRYAGYFVRDKQKLNKWGKEKIRYALMNKGLSKEIIDEALEELQVENYEEALRELLIKKSRELNKYDPYEKKNRLIRFAAQRGFDYELIFRLVDDYVRD